MQTRHNETNYSFYCGVLGEQHRLASTAATMCCFKLQQAKEDRRRDMPAQRTADSYDDLLNAYLPRRPSAERRPTVERCSYEQSSSRRASYETRSSSDSRASCEHRSAVYNDTALAASLQRRPLEPKHSEGAAGVIAGARLADLRSEAMKGDPFVHGGNALIRITQSAPARSQDQPDLLDGATCRALSISLEAQPLPALASHGEGGEGFSRRRLSRPTSRFSTHLHEQRTSSTRGHDHWRRAGAKARQVVRLAEETFSPRLSAAVGVDPRTAAAAELFEQRHRQRSATAESAFFRADSGVIGGALRSGTRRSQMRFERDLAEVRRNRYVPPPQPLLGPVRYEMKARVAAPTVFDVYRSIWRPRLFWADSHDLFDTEAVRLTRFSHDWERALAAGLVRIVMRNDDGDDDGVQDEDGDGIPDEVEEVGEAIWAHNQLLYALFSHYASLNGSLDALSLNSWTCFVNDCKLVNKSVKGCSLADFDRVFLEADALGRRSNQQATAGHATAGQAAAGHAAASSTFAHDTAHALSRVEFLIALVRVAINLFIRSRQLTDVSDAVDRLLRVCVQSQLGALVTSEPDVFRRAHCYTEATCVVLKRNEEALQRCFEYVANVDVDDGQGKHRSLPLKQWLHALRRLEIVHLDLSERDALRCFSWSRMAVGNCTTRRGHHEDTVLPFEGFVSAAAGPQPLRCHPFPSLLPVVLTARSTITLVLGA